MTTNDESAKPAMKRSERSSASASRVRTCAGCGQHAAADELVRVILDPSSGEVAADLANSGFGRGAHFHPSIECMAKALKSGLARVFKTQVKGDPAKLAEEIVTAADRRIEGLLTGARRAGQLAVGSDVVVEALKSERAVLVVVARDAAAATRLSEVERAIASGKAIAISDKKRLGSLMARDEVAVIAVLHSGVAAAALQTYRMSAAFRPLVSSAVAVADKGSEAWSSSEVR